METSPNQLALLDDSAVVAALPTRFNQLRVLRPHIHYLVLGHNYFRYPAGLIGGLQTSLHAAVAAKQETSWPKAAQDYYRTDEGLADIVDSEHGLTWQLESLDSQSGSGPADVLRILNVTPHEYRAQRDSGQLPPDPAPSAGRPTGLSAILNYCFWQRPKNLGNASAASRPQASLRANLLAMYAAVPADIDLSRRDVLLDRPQTGRLFAAGDILHRYNNEIFRVSLGSGYGRLPERYSVRYMAHMLAFTALYRQLHPQDTLRDGLQAFAATALAANDHRIGLRDPVLAGSGDG